MKRQHNPFQTSSLQAYLEAVAPESVEIREDHLAFQHAIAYPLTVRAQGLPGTPSRAWSRARAEDFLLHAPEVYSFALKKEHPDALRGSLRVRRTLMEGILLSLAEKTGRRPSRAEQATDAGLDETESRIAMGEPAFSVALITSFFTSRENVNTHEPLRRAVEAGLRAKGFVTQRLTYIPERSLLHLQPGGILFPGIHEPVLMMDEAIRLIPTPSRQLFPAEDSVWLGNALPDGRDLFFSPIQGLDPASDSAAHPTTLILGEMGSGKTSLMRLILLQRMLQGRRVITLDPEGENNKLCEWLGGKVLHAGMPEPNDTCLFHPLEAGSAAEMLFAVRFLIEALSRGRHLPAATEAALHDIIQRHWRSPAPGPLSLRTIKTTLSEMPGEHSETVSILHPYAAGGLWDGFFDRPKTKIDRNFISEVTNSGTPWWNFDLSNLREENRAIVQALLTWFLYRIVSTSTAGLDIFIDEGWRLMRNRLFADLLDEMGRRARKRGIGLFLATHLPEDLSSTSTSLALASTVFTGRLGPAQTASFLKGLGFDRDQMDKRAAEIVRLPKHHFYALLPGMRGGMFSFRVSLPPDWLELWAKCGAAR